MSIHSTAETIVNEVEYFQRLERAGVPEHLREGLVRYLVHRIQPGHFLMAVLENNLLQAIARGDEISCAALPALVRFLVNDAPGEASGSPATVREWLLAGRKLDVDLTYGIAMRGLEQSVDRAIWTIDKYRRQRDELRAALSIDDIDQIIEGIEQFIVSGDPDVREAWQEYIDKLQALRSAIVSAVQS